MVAWNGGAGPVTTRASTPSWPPQALAALQREPAPLSSIGTVNVGAGNMAAAVSSLKGVPNRCVQSMTKAAVSGINRPDAPAFTAGTAPLIGGGSAKDDA